MTDDASEVRRAGAPAGAFASLDDAQLGGLVADVVLRVAGPPGDGAPGGQHHKA